MLCGKRPLPRPVCGLCWGLMGTHAVWSWVSGSPAKGGAEAPGRESREAFEGLGFRAGPGRALVSFLPVGTELCGEKGVWALATRGAWRAGPAGIASWSLAGGGGDHVRSHGTGGVAGLQ